ncbi:unnamed protein product [Phaedon cochleariae]|uniref:THAP-type domain-containing protein n=1 Tax=Phaedon cochleariae TaxID=80249 RepID=A0A9P0DQJ0_PHACE|nr:unnamed protein product [Phaedon cochleariae]
MGFKICSVPFCTSKNRDGINLFEFPSDISLRNEWFSAILEGMALEHFEVGEYSCICINHFEKSCIRVFQDGRKRLIKGSVPTIFEQPADAWMMPTTSTGKTFKTTDWVFSNVQVQERSEFKEVLEESNNISLVVIITFFCFTLAVECLEIFSPKDIRNLNYLSIIDEMAQTVNYHLTLKKSSG